MCIPLTPLLHMNEKGNSIILQVPGTEQVLSTFLYDIEKMSD